MTAPRVSVIMSVRNGEAYLQEALDSVLTQTLRDIEIVLIDNGSTDGTPAIIAGQDDPRIRLIRNASTRTLTEALNQGLDAARAPLIARLDADDIALPDRLERQASHLDANPETAALGTGWEEFLPDGAVAARDVTAMSPEQALERFASDQPLVHSSLMARTDAVRAVGGYPVSYVYAQDFALYIALLRAGHGIEILPDLLVRIRAHPGQASRAGDWAIDRTHEALRLFQAMRTLPGMSPTARRRNRARIAEAHLRYGHALARGGRRMAGVVQVLKGVLGSPTLPVSLFLGRMARGA